MNKTIIRMFALSAWISFDGGETWREAELMRIPGPLADEMELTENHGTAGNR